MMRRGFFPALLLAGMTLSATNTLADVVNFQCSGFARNPWALLGNNVSVDAARQTVKSLDSHYEWISANFTGNAVQWVSHGASRDGAAVDYIFSLDRVNLVLTQTVSANGRAVYTGLGQCH